MQGSSFYVNDNHPPFALNKTVAMIDLNMIGWLRENKLIVVGSGSGSSFNDVLDANVKGTGLELRKLPLMLPFSDHWSFYQHGVPVLFLHTGLSETFHTPDDDFETINLAGVVRVIDFSQRLIGDLVNREDRPAFEEPTAPQQDQQGYMGVRFDFDDKASGLRIVEVAPGSPGELAGLRVGDVVHSMGGKAISQRSQYSDFLHDHPPGSKVEIKFQRDGQETTVELELGSAKVH